jgi:hypothetical protein
MHKMNKQEIKGITTCSQYGMFNGFNPIVDSGDAKIKLGRIASETKVISLRLKSPKTFPIIRYNAGKIIIIYRISEWLLKFKEE